MPTVQKTSAKHNQKNAVIYFGIFIIVISILFFKINKLDYGADTNNSTEPSGIDSRILSEINLLRNMIQNNKKDIQPYIRLGNIFFDINRKQEAIEYYKDALNIDSTNADVRIDMGICYFNLGESETAIEEVKKSLEFSPDHPNALFNLGIINYTADNKAEALVWFQKYTTVQPEGELADRVREYIKTIIE